MSHLSFKQRLAVSIIDLISRSWRIKSNFQPPAPSIVAFWHGEMLGPWKYFAGRNSTGVVSLSRDGELLAGLLARWDYTLVRGSSSRGGSSALDAITASRPRGCVLITPDGPRGPIYGFKAGAVVAASRMGLPLYLCGVRYASAKRFLKSWDRFAFPLPFSSVRLEFLGPVDVPGNASREQIDDIIRSCSENLSKITGAASISDHK